jgi:hypothetical protein
LPTISPGNKGCSRSLRLRASKWMATDNGAECVVLALRRCKRTPRRLSSTTDTLISSTSKSITVTEVFAFKSNLLNVLPVLSMMNSTQKSGEPSNSGPDYATQPAHQHSHSHSFNIMGGMNASNFGYAGRSKVTQAKQSVGFAGPNHRPSTSSSRLAA